MNADSNGKVRSSASAFDSRRHRAFWLLLILLIALADQGVKHVVMSTLPLGASLELTTWFNVVHVLNPGAAFSFLAEARGWQRLFLISVGVVVSVWLVYLLCRYVNGRLETTAYIGIAGGALGNVIDRVRAGAVVDYLDVHWRDWHWPAFNLADVFVVGGAGLLVLAAFLSGPPKALDLPGGSGRRAKCQRN